VLDPPPPTTTKLERLDDLVRQDPQRAKVEILKHLDGDLVIEPRPDLNQRPWGYEPKEAGLT